MKTYKKLLTFSFTLIAFALSANAQKAETAPEIKQRMQDAVEKHENGDVCIKWEYKTMGAVNGSQIFPHFLKMYSPDFVGEEIESFLKKSKKFATGVPSQEDTINELHKYFAKECKLQFEKAKVSVKNMSKYLERGFPIFLKCVPTKNFKDIENALRQRGEARENMTSIQEWKKFIEKEKSINFPKHAPQGIAIIIGFNPTTEEWNVVGGSISNPKKSFWVKTDELLAFTQTKNFYVLYLK